MAPSSTAANWMRLSWRAAICSLVRVSSGIFSGRSWALWRALGGSCALPTVLPVVVGEAGSVIDCEGFSSITRVGSGVLGVSRRRGGVSTVRQGCGADLGRVVWSPGGEVWAHEEPCSSNSFLTMVGRGIFHNPWFLIKFICAF